MANKDDSQLSIEFLKALIDSAEYAASSSGSKEEAVSKLFNAFISIIDNTSSAFNYPIDLVALRDSNETIEKAEEEGGDWLEQDTLINYGRLSSRMHRFEITTPEFYPALLERYSTLALALPCTHDKTSGEHIIWMLEQLAKDKKQSVTKKHRWLGFIQGVLIANGVTSVDAERELTRGIFNGA